jgi:hypothetical protein
MVRRVLVRGHHRGRLLPKRIAGTYNIGGGPHFGSGLTIDTAAALFARQ